MRSSLVSIGWGQTAHHAPFSHVVSARAPSLSPPVEQLCAFLSERGAPEGSSPPPISDLDDALLEQVGRGAPRSAHRQAGWLQRLRYFAGASSDAAAAAARVAWAARGVRGMATQRGWFDLCTSTDGATLGPASSALALFACKRISHWGRKSRKKTFMSSTNMRDRKMAHTLTSAWPRLNADGDGAGAGDGDGDGVPQR